jgi:hypothetical protein
MVSPCQWQTLSIFQNFCSKNIAEPKFKTQWTLLGSDTNIIYLCYNTKKTFAADIGSLYDNAYTYSALDRWGSSQSETTLPLPYKAMITRGTHTHRAQVTLLYCNDYVYCKKSVLKLGCIKRLAS